jgi:anti-sigma factor RsiW
MPKLTDETLMFYADGLLASPEAEHVQKMLADDKDLLARLQVFKLTGRELGDLMEDHVNAPVPQRLLDCFAEPSPEPSILMHAYRGLRSVFASAFEGLRFSGDWGLKPSMAMAALALMVGLGIGMSFRGDRPTDVAEWDDLIRANGNQLVAQGALEQTLENAPSGETSNVALADNRQIDMAVRMTFKNAAGDYCRQYEIAVPDARNYTGIACHSGGEWVVRIQAMTAPSQSDADRIVPASGSDRLAIDAAINALVFGAPLNGEEEAAALGNGWK